MTTASNGAEVTRRQALTRMGALGRVEHVLSLPSEQPGP